MTPEEFILRRAVVFATAVVYWVGVWIQARRVWRHIGRPPNIRPRGGKEKLLWVGWLVVVIAWCVQPLLAGQGDDWSWLRLSADWLHPPFLVLGLLLAVAGYAGTLWCYAAMGDSWRMGVNRNEKNALVRHGPYRFVRHPIYLFQVVLLAGAACLLPSSLSLIVLVIHAVCVWIKAADEESYLLSVHGQEYRDYLARTGRLLPKMGSRS